MTLTIIVIILVIIIALLYIINKSNNKNLARREWYGIHGSVFSIVNSPHTIQTHHGSDKVKYNI